MQAEIGTIDIHYAKSGQDRVFFSSFRHSVSVQNKNLGNLSPVTL